jgi:hypothetical protein
MESLSGATTDESLRFKEGYRSLIIHKSMELNGKNHFLVVVLTASTLVGFSNDGIGFLVGCFAEVLLKFNVNQ